VKNHKELYSFGHQLQSVLQLFQTPLEQHAQHPKAPLNNTTDKNKNPEKQETAISLGGGYNSPSRCSRTGLAISAQKTFHRPHARKS